LINQLWQEILGEEFLVRPRLSRIHYGGHYFAYPLKALDALAGLGPVEALLVGLSYTKARLLPGKEETNFEQWVSNRFGDRLYRIFFKTYTEKVWGIPCTEISADWAVQRIRNLSLSEALRNALFGARRAKDGGVITTLIDSFHYPRYGPGMMWERCEELLAERGSVTLRGLHIDRIRHRRGRVEVIGGRTAAGERVAYEAEHYISTMPLSDLIHTLDPAPPAEVLRAAQRLRYRDYLTVVLVVKRAEVFPDNWIYIHSPEVKMGRIQNYKNWSPDMVPDPSRTSLGLEYFLWDKDEEWNWPSQRLIEMGIQECARIGLLEPGEVEDGTVVRMQKAYPVYDQYYHHSVATVRHYLESLENFQTIGRNGLHRYNNQDHSMLTGVYAARNVIGEHYDVWSVNTELEYQEEGQVTSGTAGDRLVPIPLPATETPQAPAPDEIIAAAFADLDPPALGVAIGVVSGVGIFLMTAVLLLKDGPQIGPNLALLRYYLPGFTVTWKGALVGLVDAGVGGFILGSLGAWLRNWGMAAYVALVQRRAEARARRDLLDKV
jgi:protoporphyrinogen oxidase